MTRNLRALGVVLVFVTPFVAAVEQESIPPALAAMAETEREFARTAPVKGWRDAFLEFFADDAIAFAPEVASAKERLRTQPSTPFSEFELLWEPRTGDVAASGELGWLTGPSTAIAHKGPESKPRYGCYLSVWRKQADGRWRVFIDIGAQAPEPVAFAPGFTRIDFGERYAGKDGKEAATRSLAQADRKLNTEISALGTARAYRSALAPAARLHRTGTVPILGPDQIATWLEQTATAVTARDRAAEAAASGDFGYTHGTFDAATPKPSAGVYVRLWSRDSAGRWWLMTEVVQDFKPNP